MFNGFFKFILSHEAKNLRKLFIFKLVPVLNPDGVTCGNYRSSVAGVDLNRQWNEPSKILHPTVFYLKETVAKLKKERDVFLFCDIHGHSRKRNSFLYGNKLAANGGFLSWTKVRLLPRILAKKSEMYSYKGSKFKVEKCKRNTARVVCWDELKITNSFTLENSFYGY